MRTSSQHRSLVQQNVAGWRYWEREARNDEAIRVSKRKRRLRWSNRRCFVWICEKSKRSLGSNFIIWVRENNIILTKTELRECDSDAGLSIHRREERPIRNDWAAGLNGRENNREGKEVIGKSSEYSLRFGMRWFVETIIWKLGMKWVADSKLRKTQDSRKMDWDSR